MVVTSERLRFHCQIHPFKEWLPNNTVGSRRANGEDSRSWKEADWSAATESKPKLLMSRSYEKHNT